MLDPAHFPQQPALGIPTPPLQVQQDKDVATGGHGGHDLLHFGFGGRTVPSPTSISAREYPTQPLKGLSYYQH
jgi:hypothetical protein